MIIGWILFSLRNAKTTSSLKFIFFSGRQNVPFLIIYVSDSFVSLHSNRIKNKQPFYCKRRQRINYQYQRHIWSKQKSYDCPNCLLFCWFPYQWSTFHNSDSDKVFVLRWFYYHKGFLGLVCYYFPCYYDPHHPFWNSKHEYELSGKNPLFVMGRDSDGVCDGQCDHEHTLNHFNRRMSRR